MSDTAGVVNPMGLRERKKARTRAVIRQEALRLFRERGYSGTTVEQIAAAADVSPATFFRYYPTKEDVVLQDDLDVLLPEAVEAQPAGLNPIAAVRAAIKETMGQLGPAELDRLQETI
jgi:AcrR family transcriptional regulator